MDNSTTNNNRNNMEDTESILSTMRTQELQYLAIHHLQITKKTPATASIVDVSCRQQVCRWIFHTTNTIGMQTETATIAIGYLDRFMSTNVPRANRARCNRREYQLIGLTCLYIAVKITEPVLLSADVMSEISRGTYSEETIKCCERHVLATLQWKLSGPTSNQFIHYLLQLVVAAPREDSDKTIEICSVAQGQVEVAVIDAACVPLRRSTIAIAAILNALQEQQEDTDNCNDDQATAPQDEDTTEVTTTPALSSDKEQELISKISNVVGYDITESQMIHVCRERLANLLSRRKKISRANSRKPVCPSSPKSVNC